MQMIVQKHMQRNMYRAQACSSALGGTAESSAGRANDGGMSPRSQLGHPDTSLPTPLRVLFGATDRVGLGVVQWGHHG